MKTTTSPKVKKTTAKRGRPVGSKKSICLPGYPEVEKFIIGKIKEEIKINKAWEEFTPDSQATAEQVKDWSRFKPQNEVETPINYWKYARIAILIGVVAGMIIATPTVINLAEVCSQ